MQVFMVVIDLAWFLFWRILKVGTLASMIWFFAVEADKAQRHGLIDLRAYSEVMIGQNVKEKVRRDRERRQGLSEFQEIYGKPVD